MTISVGDRLPSTTFIKATADGPQPVDSNEFFRGRKVALFAVPGAFTPTCHAAHLPSFIRTSAALRAKGVDEIACVAVNDPFVLEAWGEATGALSAGIRMLGDPAAAFTRAIGLDYDAPARGLLTRSKRYAMLAEDGVVRVLNLEESPGQCELSAGETLLAAI